MMYYYISLFLLTTSPKICGSLSYELRDPTFFLRDRVARRYDHYTGAFDPPLDFSRDESSLLEDPSAGAGSIVDFDFGLGFADVPYLLAVAYGDRILMHGIYAGFEGRYNHTCEGGRLSHYECVEGYAPGNRTTVDVPSLEADLHARGSRYSSMAYQGGLSANLAWSESTSPSSRGGTISVQSNDMWAPDVGWMPPHSLGDGYKEQTIPVRNGVTALAFEPHSGINDFSHSLGHERPGNTAEPPSPRDRGPEGAC